MMATIVNAKHDHGPASLIEPPNYCYLLLAATVAPPNGPPLLMPNPRRGRVLSGLAGLIRGAAALNGVLRATGYRAVLIPPAHAPRFRPDLLPPKFDVTVLIETDSAASLPDVALAPVITAMRDLLGESASRVKEMQARCVRAIADFDKPSEGVYLFNYWAAAESATALEVWEHLATWFQAKTGLQNSTVLQSTGDDDFAFVNHARWDARVSTIAVRQFLRPTFYTFVRSNLAANELQVYPALYRRI